MALGVHKTKVQLRIGIALHGGVLIPFGGLTVILRYALAVDGGINLRLFGE
jgi:hypothetical protein